MKYDVKIITLSKKQIIQIIPLNHHLRCVRPGILSESEFRSAERVQPAVDVPINQIPKNQKINQNCFKGNRVKTSGITAKINSNPKGVLINILI